MRTVISLGNPFGKNVAMHNGITSDIFRLPAQKVMFWLVSPIVVTSAGTTNCFKNLFLTLFYRNTATQNIPLHKI